MRADDWKSDPEQLQEFATRKSSSKNVYCLGHLSFALFRGKLYGFVWALWVMVFCEVSRKCSGVVRCFFSGNFQTMSLECPRNVQETSRKCLRNLFQAPGKLLKMGGKCLGWICPRLVQEISKKKSKDDPEIS